MNKDLSKEFIVNLSDSFNAWKKSNFDEVFKREVSRLGVDKLPLQQSLSQGSYACENDIKVILLRRSEDEAQLRIKAGIFFSSMIAGCNCADDPSPVDELSEYCELQFEIDKMTAKAKIRQIS